MYMYIFTIMWACTYSCILIPQKKSKIQIKKSKSKNERTSESDTLNTVLQRHVVQSLIEKSPQEI